MRRWRICRVGLGCGEPGDYSLALVGFLACEACIRVLLGAGIFTSVQYKLGVRGVYLPYLRCWCGRPYGVVDCSAEHS